MAPCGRVGVGWQGGDYLMPTVIERMHEALNQHDLEAFLECIDENYRSEQPIHPNRGYMELVEEDGENIDEAMQRMTGRDKTDQSEEASPT